MQYRLNLLLWVTTVVAVGLGAFGGGGLIAAACTFYFWGFLFATHGPAPQQQSRADTLMFVVLMGSVFLSGAVTLQAMRGRPNPSGYPATQYLLIAGFVALSATPALAYRRGGPS